MRLVGKFQDFGGCSCLVVFSKFLQETCVVPLKLACLKEDKEELDTLDLRPVIHVNSESRITAKKLNSPCPAIFSVSRGRRWGT